jgi:hypothetical protein
MCGCDSDKQRKMQVKIIEYLLKNGVTKIESSVKCNCHKIRYEQRKLVVKG